MVHQGQLVYQFDANRDEQFFYQRATQMIQLSRFILIFLIIAAIIAMLVQFEELESSDLIIFGLFLGIVYVLYRALLQRISNLENPELVDLEEHLAIYEYGIEFPPLSNSDLNPNEQSYLKAPHEFIRYNSFREINITDQTITFVTTSGDYTIDLVYFPFYSAEEGNYEEQLDLLLTIIDLIRDNLSKVENRDHPTIIPKAYFRDSLPSG